MGNVNTATKIHTNVQHFVEIGYLLLKVKYIKETCFQQMLNVYVDFQF